MVSADVKHHVYLQGALCWPSLVVIWWGHLVSEHADGLCHQKIMGDLAVIWCSHLVSECADGLCHQKMMEDLAFIWCSHLVSECADGLCHQKIMGIWMPLSFGTCSQHKNNFGLIESQIFRKQHFPKVAGTLFWHTVQSSFKETCIFFIRWYNITFVYYWINVFFCLCF